MNANKTITAVLKRIEASIDIECKARSVAALRKAADLLEQDPRPLEEATRAIFARVIADFTRQMNAVCSESAAEDAVRELVGDAKQILAKEDP